MTLQTDDLQAIETIVIKVVTKVVEDRLDIFAQQVAAGFAQVDERFAQVDARFEQVDARFELMEARFVQIDARFDQIDSQLVEIIDDVKILKHVQATEVSRVDHNERNITRIQKVLKAV